MISDLSIAGPQAIDFAMFSPPALPVTLAPGAVLDLALDLRPTGHGTRNAQLAIASDALGTPTRSVALLGAGSGPRIALTPAALDFGASSVGVASAPRTLQIANSGETALVITSIVLGGANAADFSTSASLPLTIAAGSSAAVSFGFAPSAVGGRTATATVISDDPLAPTAEVTLAGTGESAVIAAAPASLAFGGVRVGQSRTLQVMVRNTGTASLTIASTQLSGSGVSGAGETRVAGNVTQLRALLSRPRRST